MSISPTSGGPVEERKGQAQEGGKAAKSSQTTIYRTWSG